VALLNIPWVPYKPLWRNWLARSAVNRKAGGSIPPRGASYLKSVIMDLCLPIMNLNPAKACSVETVIKIFLHQRMTVESTVNLQVVIFRE
jgi:hypothetical protein